MNSEQEERYVFYRFSAGDIQECKKTLEMLEHARDDSMRLALIKAAIISYARPFSSNESKFKSKEKWRLDKNLVPEHHKETSEMAINYRDKFIAHNDIPQKTPELIWDGIGFAIGHNTPQEEYLEFANKLYLASAELLAQLFEWIIDYEKDNFQKQTRYKS